MTPAALEAALRYASAGWPVFPCRPGGKTPAFPSAHPEGDARRTTCKGECGQHGHGVNDATTDPAVIRAWWARVPGANVGIATGAPGPDVLDIDNDASGWTAYDTLRRAGMLAGAFALIRTRARGLHVYFVGTSQRCTAKIGGASLDYRSAGGYVLAPPSYVTADAKGPAGAYETVDKRPHTGATFDLGAAIAMLTPPRRTPPRRTSGQPSTTATALAAWVIANAKPGYRHEPIRWMAKKLADAGQLDDDGAAAVVDTAEAIGLEGGAQEAIKVIRSYGGSAAWTA